MTYRLHMIGGPKDGVVVEYPDAPPEYVFASFRRPRTNWFAGTDDALETTLVDVGRIVYVRIGFNPDRNPFSVGYRYKP